MEKKPDVGKLPAPCRQGRRDRWHSVTGQGSPWALVLGLGLLGPASATALCLSDQPLVSRPVEVAPDDIAHAKQVLIGQGFWRAPGVSTAATGAGRLDLSARDLDQLLNYLASRRADGRMRARLHAQRAEVEASFSLPANPFGRYLNLRGTLREADPLPEFESLRLACLPVPGWVIRWVQPLALQLAGVDDYYRLAAETVRHVGITPAGVRVAYAGGDDVLAHVRELALPQAERARLRVYQGLLAQLSRRPAPARGMSLADLLAPMLELAAQRSASGDAAAEQRALIAVLAFHVTGRRWAEVLPEARSWPAARARAVTLRGRVDLAQHFVVSAALAAYAGSIVADAIGLNKEVEDSRGGSGFSFVDLTADRAGTRFGQRLVGGAALRPVTGEDAIMPPIADLPEFMQEAEFQHRFGGVGAPAYRALAADIERRLDACVALR